MMRLNFVIFMGVCSCVCFAKEDFVNFRLKFNKNYLGSELPLRQKIFNKNLAKIEEHNKQYEQGLVSYEMGVNQFSDLTEKEFSSRFNTLPIDDVFLRYQTSEIDADNLPTSVDWRTVGAVTPIKDQGACGGCWTFSAAGTLEGLYALTYGKLLSFSEQELLDCTTNSNNGCSGGVVQYAIDYVSQNGLTTEDQYPYKAVQGVCGANSKPPAIGVAGYIGIRQYNETDLKMAVATQGPVSVAVNADPIQNYKSGIFNGNCSDAINHGVLVVGYNATKSSPYWIVKNSWGTIWGESGYYKMAMGVGTGLCGIARQACYPYGVTNSTKRHSDDGGDGGGANAIWQNTFVTVLGLFMIAIRNIW